MLLINAVCYRFPYLYTLSLSDSHHWEDSWRKRVRCSQDLSTRPLLVSTSLDLDIATRASGELWWRRNIDGVTAAAVVSDALLVYVICHTVGDRRGDALVARNTVSSIINKFVFPQSNILILPAIFLQHVRYCSSIYTLFTAAILSLLSATL